MMGPITVILNFLTVWLVMEGFDKIAGLEHRKFNMIWALCITAAAIFLK